MASVVNGEASEMTKETNSEKMLNTINEPSESTLFSDNELPITGAEDDADGRSDISECDDTDMKNDAKQPVDEISVSERQHDDDDDVTDDSESENTSDDEPAIDNSASDESNHSEAIPNSKSNDEHNSASNSGDESNQSIIENKPELNSPESLDANSIHNDGEDSNQSSIADNHQPIICSDDAVSQHSGDESNQLSVANDHRSNSSADKSSDENSISEASDQSNQSGAIRNSRSNSCDQGSADNSMSDTHRSVERSDIKSPPHNSVVNTSAENSAPGTQHGVERNEQKNFIVNSTNTSEESKKSGSEKVLKRRNSSDDDNTMSDAQHSGENSSQSSTMENPPMNDCSVENKSVSDASSDDCLVVDNDAKEEICPVVDELSVKSKASDVVVQNDEKKTSTCEIEVTSAVKNLSSELPVNHKDEPSPMDYSEKEHTVKLTPESQDELAAIPTEQNKSIVVGNKDSEKDKISARNTDVPPKDLNTEKDDIAEKVILAKDPHREKSKIDSSSLNEKHFDKIPDTYVSDSFKGLDLSVKPVFPNEAADLTVKRSHVSEGIASNFNPEPLNFSCSTRSVSPKQVQLLKDRCDALVKNMHSTKNKKSPIIDSENESILSENNHSCEDSDSVDSKEVHVDSKHVVAPKVNEGFYSADKIICKPVQNDVSVPHKRNKVKRRSEGSRSGSTPKKNKHDDDAFPELSPKETGFPSAFTGMVTIGKYLAVKGDFTLRSTEALVESPSLIAPFLLKEPDKFPVRETEPKPEPKNFFHSFAGEFLIGIGLSRVHEWFHRDMMRIKKRQIKREGKQPHLEKELELFQNSYVEAKRANDAFTFPYRSCDTCNFTTESSIVMEGHLLVPHITQRREYQCNFCTLVERDPREMLQHMEIEHRKFGRIQPAVLFYECPFCTFESNSKVKLNTHLTKCQRYFDHTINQTPNKDFEFPALTPKPITVAVVKAYERSLSSMHRGRGRPKRSSMDMIPQQFPTRPVMPNHNLSGFRSNPSISLADSLSSQSQMMSQVPLPGINMQPAHSNPIGQLHAGMPPLHLPNSNRFFQVVNSGGQMLPMLGNSHLVTSPSQFPFSSSLSNSGMKKLQSPTTPTFFSTLFGNGLRQPSHSKASSDLSMLPPLPKLQGPYPVQLSKSTAPSANSSLQSSSLVVCEICDGYIKDLEALRTHMQLIHKVKIHPKMLVSRPPLNCQKCQWRFFTDQGLERHLLGAHGLVTSNMQELANKSKDAGCCTICGRVYASKLVSHMNQVHKVSLKPAHLSYKCTVCSATFNLYRLFENHVYLVHSSSAAKRPSDSGISPAKKLAKSRENSDSSDFLDEYKNHKEKNSEKRLSFPKDADHVAKKCIDCGNDVTEKKKNMTQVEKCDKCLRSEGLIQGLKSCKEELMKKDRGIEKAAF